MYIVRTCTYLGAADGKLTACVPNPAVDSELLEKVYSWIRACVIIDDVIERLRLQTVPIGFSVYTWTEGTYLNISTATCRFRLPRYTCVGKDKSKVEKLRSILAQLEYKYQINLWQSKGVPFKNHLYVPEVHPVTGLDFCEREDEAHALKVSLCDYMYASVTCLSLVCMHIARTHARTHTHTHTLNVYTVYTTNYIHSTWYKCTHIVIHAMPLRLLNACF